VNIAVCIKQVPDTEARIRIAEDGKSISKEDIKWIVNPYDEFAVEEALKLTEKFGGEVTVISLGPPGVEKSIREALAMGPKKAIRIQADTIPTDPQATAKALAEVLKQNNYDLILFGKQAIDDDQVQVPQIVAHVLGIPCASVVVKLDIDPQAGSGEALREVEGGHEKLTFKLPAVVTAQRGLNEPRYRSLKGIMQAKKIPIEVVESTVASDQLIIEKLEYPPEKKPGRIVGTGTEAVPELVRLLREEAKVL